MYKTLFAFLVFSLSLAQHVQASYYNLNSRRISVQDGLAGNSINEMVQDGEGYVWMATNNGLSRYDGYSTMNYVSLSNDPKMRMEARVGHIVYDDARQLLWMRTATYMNVCYDLVHDRFVDWTGVGQNRLQLNKFFFSRKRGMFFFGYSSGVRRSCYDGETFSVTDYKAKDGSLPSDEVLMLQEDAEGNIWMVTDKGVVRLDVNDQTHILLKGKKIVDATTSEGRTYFLTAAGEAFVLDASGATVLTSRLPSSMDIVSKVNISFVWQKQWMLFTPQGTYAMNIKSGEWKVESGDKAIVDGLNQGSLPGYHFVANRSGRLLIFSDKGTCRRMDLISNAQFSTMVGRKFHVAADNEGRLFIATYGAGLYVWNPVTDELRHFTAEDPNPIIRSNYLTTIMCDRQGCMWLGSEATGAYSLSVMTGATTNYLLPEPNHQGDWANAVSSVAERPDGQIMIGTREGGIYQYDRSSGKMSLLDTRGSSVMTIFTDSGGHLWMGTGGDGLFVDREQYCKESTTHHLQENKIYDIEQDGQGRIWIATRDGGLLMTEPAADGRPMTFRQFLADEMNESRIHDIEIDPKGILWAATNNGIYRLDTNSDHLSNQLFKSYNTANGMFPVNEIFTLHYSEADSMLWVGAAGLGAVKCCFASDGSKLEMHPVTTREGLANNNVYSLAEDRYGFIWAATEEGISRINTRNNIVNTYQPSPVLQGNVASENCALLTHDGVLFVGTNYGLITIVPEPHQQVQSVARAHITDIKVNGQSVPYEEMLTLAFDQNSLDFYFSAFNYSNVQSSLYQYYLEGVESTWNPMTIDHHASYSMLSPGRYVFHLRSLGSDNEWQEETVFSVTIRHPWYATWWAWLIYLLLASLFSWYVYRNWKEKFDLHQQMKLERQLADFRSQLFTNITHEFRTPLAIIKGAVDKLSVENEKNNSTLDKQALQTVRKGTKRMLRLVNQFMEFRKASTGNLRLKAQQGDIVALLKDICQDFWPMARQKDIQLTFLPSVRSLPMVFDHDIVETVVYNLLSNAIKYTPQRGSVQLRMRSSEPEVPSATLTIEVEDSGPGISTERQKVLFQPFMKGLASQGGMGIGLYTAFEMAKVHNGQLTYQCVSTPEGMPSGSLFTLKLPISTDEQVSYEMPARAEAKPEEGGEASLQLSPEAVNDVTIAIIEDDPDMMEQLRSELGVYFHIDSYMNGQTGFQGVSQHVPALLLCDVMLPDMDGYDIVRHLRQQQKTHTLPVIMLTALDDDEHQIKAYQAGADDYMVKPCNFRLLVARMLQLIKWNLASAHAVRPSLPEKKHEAAADVPVILSSQADKVFLDKLAMFTAQHLSEETFNVDRLSELMQMGRTRFYGRVKELTGVSPNKYLMQQRMQRAADLLADGELNVSEVSYRVGLQDPSYFNKCFKAHFGVVPSKYTRPQ